MRTAKKEMNSRSARVTRRSGRNADESQGATDDSGAGDAGGEGMAHRSKNKNRTSDASDEIAKDISLKLKPALQEADSLNKKAHNSNPLVGETEDLFDMAKSLVTSVKAFNGDGITSSDFVSGLLRKFGQGGGTGSSRNELRSLIRWEDLGQTVSHVFMSVPGFRTMVGPMDTEMKQRKIAAPRKRSKPAENSHPEELENTDGKTETDKNMATMFNVLKKNRKANLENLILNRKSFAQTVENLFALSFLVKDGRAELSVDNAGRHLVSPRNAPSALAIQSGESTYNHFMFRYDYKDWKSMLDSVAVGEELMPHRLEENEASNTEPDVEFDGSRASQPSTPIRKLCRNRGLVMQEQTVVEDSPESDNSAAGSSRSAGIRRAKRKLR